MINWKVRINNPNFWMAIIPSTLLAVQLILGLFGVTMDFGELGNKLKDIVNAIFTVLSILGVTNDPTTAGLKDSLRAMTYQEPYQD